MGRVPFPPPDASDKVWEQWENMALVKLTLYSLILIGGVAVTTMFIILYIIVNN